MANKPKLILCPYCGNTQSAPADRCGACGGYFDELSLKATQEHMGPWFIRDSQNPYRPGCTYEVLLKQVQRGKITPTTILRGPTTRQFWSVARNVPGISHLLGYCHACGAHVEHGTDACGQCGEVFFAPKVRDNLGLAPAARLNDSGSFVTELDETGQPIGQPADDQPLSIKQTQTAPPAPPASEEPDGSSILAGLRSGEPALRASAEVNASRDALAWMTTAADAKPDTLATASQPAQTTRHADYLTWVLVSLVGIMFVALVFVVLQQVLPARSADPGTDTTTELVADDDTTEPPEAGGEAQTQSDIVTTTDKTTTPPPDPRRVWQQLFDQARQLELDGRFEEAMALYTKIQTECPAPLTPPGLDATIHALEKKIGEAETDTFFTG